MPKLDVFIQKYPYHYLVSTLACTVLTFMCVVCSAGEGEHRQVHLGPEGSGQGQGLTRSLTVWFSLATAPSQHQHIVLRSSFPY